VKVAILGAGGQLAYDLQRVMPPWEQVALRHADLDICDHDRVRERLNEIRPEVVINTAAFHRVDDCEGQVEKAFAVNTFAVRNLAQVCAELECTLVHISTDYVFGGEKRSPYTEEDLPGPLNVYGVSKLAGEYFVRHLCPKHFVVRSSGLYGVAGSSGKGGNFVETMLRLAREGKRIRVVNDQVLAPTWTKDLAEKVVELLRSRAYGLYHVADEGGCSWHEFAGKIFELVGFRPDFAPTTTGAFGAGALRPAYSVLSPRSLVNIGLEPMPPWPVSLQAYLVEKGHAVL
jgi:dTDP-4-dehydrorhamnose reductase